MSEGKQFPAAHAFLVEILETGQAAHREIIRVMEETPAGETLKQDPEFLIAMARMAASAYSARNFLAEYVKTEFGIDPDNDEQVEEYLRRAAH